VEKSELLYISHGNKYGEAALASFSILTQNVKNSSTNGTQFSF
jgi:hypothetical protein